MDTVRWIGPAVRLFGLQSQVKLQRLMQYRVDFAVGMVACFALSATGPVFQLLIYARTSGYPGWTWRQILVFQAVLLLSTGIREVFFGDVRPQIERLVERGEFDRLLLKPFPPLLHLLSGGFAPHALGTLLAGTGTLIWAARYGGAAPDPVAYLLFVVFLGAATLLHLSVHILYCTLTLRWTYPLRLSESMDRVATFGEYPQEVFPLALRTVLVTVLPLSVATYWPAQALLGRVNAVAWIALAGAVALTVVVVRLWGRQLRHYASAGG
jgi:ABC-2 type transport system permease protein